MSKRKVQPMDSPNAKPFYFQGGEHGILLVHGFTGSAGHMRMLGEMLHDQGFTVRGINLPGHGTVETDMVKTDWQDWLHAVQSAVAEMRSTCKYTSVAGLSMGGDLTLIMAAQVKLTAAVAISAPMGMMNKYGWLAPVLWPFVPTMSWKGDESRLFALDQRYDFGYSSFPTRRVGDLSHLIKMAKEGLPQISCPLLSIQSHQDTAVERESSDRIMAGAASKIKKQLWLDGVPHVCTISKEAPHIASVMGAFLRQAEQEG